MDTASHVIANLDAGQMVAATFLAGFLWAGFAWLIIGIIHGASKSDQVSRTNFAAQDAVSAAEQIAAEVSADETEEKKVLADA